MKGGGRPTKSYSKYTKPIPTGGPGASSGGSGTTDCANISFPTQLQKVQPALSTVVAGDMLSLRYSAKTVSVHNDVGAVCGYIVSPYNTQLIECMKKGHRFKATVLSISGTICQAHIEIS